MKLGKKITAIVSLALVSAMLFTACGSGSSAKQFQFQTPHTNLTGLF